ncbi:MAG: hypothetical protein ABI588_07290 [Arenimonas sp.]
MNCKQNKNGLVLSMLAAACGLAVAPAVLAGPADKVYRPIVEKGEAEIELRGGYFDFGDGADEYASVLDIGYAFTNNWKSELVFEYEGETGGGAKPEAVEWENLIVLTEQGKHWADVGLLIELEHTFSAAPEEFKLGLLLEKEVGPTIADLNLVAVREFGSGASDETGLEYRWQLKWRGNEALEWGMQGFGDAGTFEHLGQDTGHSIGPALFGLQRLQSGNKLAYDAAILAGLNAKAPDLTFRFNLEYEIY